MMKMKTYKIKCNPMNSSLPHHSIVPCIRTRNSDPNKFVQIPTRINTYAYSFYPRVIRACNLLANEISTFQLVPQAHINRLYIQIVGNMLA